MYEYRFAKPQEMPAVVDFIDLVFSQLRIPHDFETILPKVYGEGHDSSSMHAIALEDGAVRGCVAIYPYEMTMAGETLKVGYLGSVSVHRHARGGGHMRHLMELQLRHAAQSGLDMVVLGGQRQRYGYYGFTPCGTTYSYSVTAANVRHALGEADASGISFEKMTQAHADYAFGLYSRQPVCGARTRENFVETACSFWQQPWVILKDGQPVGYLISNDSGSDVSEIITHDAALIPTVLKGWLSFRTIRSAQIAAAAYDIALNRTLAAFCEGSSIYGGCYLLCLRPANVLRAWMKLHNSVKPLADGSLRLGWGQTTLQITVKDGGVSVEETAEPADLALSEAEACALAFSFNRFCAPEADVPAGWFPLPLFIPKADHF